MKELFNLQNNTKFFVLVLIACIIYAIYYFVKNFETIEFQLKALIIILIAGFVFGIYKSFRENINFLALRNNFSVTSGNINQYFVPNLKGGVSSRGISSSTNYIKYVYSVDTINFENAYDFNNFVDIPDEKPSLKVEYLVIYEITNPKNSFILLNYPIRNSNDLDRYKKLFINEIPKNVFKHSVK